MRPRLRSIRLSEFIVIAMAVASTSIGNCEDPAALYNGVVVPEWPPRDVTPGQLAPIPPYLATPPDVIPIDVGRQLFVDDFLIQETTMTREYHLPAYHPDNPVLMADRPWEHTGDGKGEGPMAMPFSGGVWYDPADSLFKMWYFADYRDRHLCYAISVDGVHWDKPDLDVVPGTNIVMENTTGASVVWLDLEEPNPERRFKLILTKPDPDSVPQDAKWDGSLCTMRMHFSHDGIHWSPEMAKTGPCGDRNSAFWNPFRKQWVFSIRHYGPWFEDVKHSVRCRKYWESPDLLINTLWKYDEPVLWTGPDRLDPARAPSTIPELYNLDSVAYESVLLGLFSIHRVSADTEKRPKINEVCLGFSRDGFHWYRPDRRPFLPVSENPEDWNWGNVQSVGGGCLLVGDELWFYASGRKGNFPGFCDAGGSTGLAVLRRDGFASMNAGAEAATLTTRMLRFSGRHLFVNADVEQGELRADVLDPDGNVIEPFSNVNCVPVQKNSTCCEVRWQGGKDLSQLARQPVQFRFHLKQGALYAFWVSPEPSGASHGYVAAGGPGYTGPVDAVGKEVTVRQ